MKRIKLKVKGMHCGSCVKIIEESLSEAKGIKSIKVDLADETAEIEFDKNIVTIDKIKSEIETLGYSVGDEPTSNHNKKKTILQGIAYGLIPHIGCIAFIIGSILGVTLLMQFFKPLLMNRYFFHVLILISLLFATLASVLYLRKNKLLSFKGMKRKWKYLSTMYGSTIGINLVLFMLIFPMLANVSIASPTGGAVIDGDKLSSIKLKVDIPCPGHAPLISEELKTIDGVMGIKFGFPNNFDVKYDSDKTSISEMTSLEVFDEYKAQVLDKSEPDTVKTTTQVSTGSCCGGSSGCSSSGGGSCGCGG